MRRRLIKQGHNTMTLTLPIEWVRKLNLQNKNEVDVIEQENTLIINAQEKIKEKGITIDISDLIISMLWRYFQAIYRAGYDEIKIIFDSNKKDYSHIYHPYSVLFAETKYAEKFPPKPAIDMIQDLINRFIGVEIIETGKNYCIVKDMAELTSKEYNNAFRRIFMLISGIFERILNAIENNEVGDAKICKEIHALDLNVDRFVDYSCRMLNKVYDSAPQRKKPSIFATLFVLEVLSNEFKQIADHLSKSKKKVNQVLEFGKLVKEHFHLYEKLFYDFNKQLTVNFGKNALSICEEHIKIKKQLSGESRSIARHFVQISKCLIGLAELRIEMEFN